jgi:hypothetical protein
MLDNEWRKSKKSNGNGGNNCVEACVVSFYTATKSNPSGNCVEVALTAATKSGAAGHCVQVGFATAAKSGPNSDNCVEVSFAGNGVSVSENNDAEASTTCTCNQIRTQDGMPVSGAVVGDVLVRDSKHKGKGPILVFKPDQWRAFLAKVKVERMNWPQTMQGNYMVESPDSDLTILLYTKAEWDAFLDGVDKGEFDLPAAA